MQHIRGLFHQPTLEWVAINQESYKSVFFILRNYFLTFLFLIPFSISLRLFFVHGDFKLIFYQAWLIGWIILGGYFFILYLMSIIMEEAANFMGGKAVPGSGAKLSYFSALPFLFMLILAPLPRVGFIIMLVSFAYNIALIYIGASEIFKLEGSKKILWFVSVVVSFLLLLFLVLLLAALISLFMHII